MAGAFMAAALKGARRLRTEPVKPMDVGPAEPLAGKGKGAMGRLGNIARQGKMRVDRRAAKRSRRGY